MKALVYKGPMQMAIEEVADPSPGSADLLLEVEAAGICGSDVHGYAGDTGRRKPGMVMGHEVAGRVIGTGSTVEGWEIGDYVTVNPVIGCLRCRMCQRGNPNLCLDRRVIGVDSQYLGGYAERMVVPARNAVRLPPGFWQGALVEPIAVGLQAARHLGIGLLTKVAVLGGGMIGLAVGWAALRDGATHVYIGDIDRAKVDRAAKLGAIGLLLNGRSLKEALAVLEESAILGVVDATGLSATLNAAIEAVGHGGTVCLVGMGSPTVEFPAYAITTGERTVVGSFCYSDAHFVEAAWALKDGAVAAEFFVDEHIDLESAPEVFRQLATGERTSVKTVIRVSSGSSPTIN